MSQRLDRINELMKREISSIVQKDFEFKNALVTISDVEVTQDLVDDGSWWAFLQPTMYVLRTRNVWVQSILYIYTSPVMNE